MQPTIAPRPQPTSAPTSTLTSAPTGAPTIAPISSPTSAPTSLTTRALVAATGQLLFAGALVEALVVKIVGTLVDVLAGADVGAPTYREGTPTSTAGIRADRSGISVSTAVRA